MRWILMLYFSTTVLLRNQQLEAKLALELSPKSSEVLSNTIYGSSNNRIEDYDKKEKQETEDAFQEAGVQEQELEVNFNDVKNQGNIQNQIKAVQKEMIAVTRNATKEKLNQPEFNKIGEIIAANKKIRKIAAANTSSITTRKPMQHKKFSTQFFHAKTQRPTSFVNPFGQLSTFFGTHQLHYLQDYNFLFNAERHTIFQLHTSAVTARSNLNTSAGRVLNTVVGGSFSAALGVNSMAGTGGSSAKVEEVHLYNAASLRQSRFNPFNPTRILIHGWFGGSHAGVYNTLIPEYLKLENGSYNIFTVDWGRGAIADYITASYRVKPVGKVVAKFIDFLHQESGMRFEDLHVVGFSMGAHIAGIAGKFVQTGRLPIIYALDPALPLFRYENIDERIALTDADYVEVIHTSVGSYGYDRPLGHVDFYVNYGSGQPGCFFNECSHFRAFQVFAESLNHPNAFRGEGCDVKLWLDLIKNRRCLMATGRNLTMGGNPIDAVALRKRGGGVYILPTNSSPPFGQS